MKFALINDLRVTPIPHTRGICELCNEEVISKCGPIRPWHWSHKAKTNCDPWWENETPWHKDWKNNYPKLWHEVVHHDEASGEKHIADIKTDNGLIIEFQNSPMTLAELQAREKFYKKIVWVINGAKFIQSFHIFHELPTPNLDLFADIVFQYPSRHHSLEIFYRKSENPPNLIHPIQELENEIAQHYQGHHFYEWVKPRSVWLRSNKPVYIDFGGDTLWSLQKYGNTDLPCVQGVCKQYFIDTTTNAARDFKGSASSFNPR